MLRGSLSRGNCKLKDEKLYMEVYHRRENLRFFGIEEVAGEEEDTK